MLIDMSEYSEAYSRPVKASRQRNTSSENKKQTHLMMGLDFGERFISEIHLKKMFVLFKEEGLKYCNCYLYR